MKLVTLIVFLFAALAGYLQPQAKVDDCMGLTFNASANQYVNFGAPSSLNGLTQKTWLTWVNIAGLPGAGKYPDIYHRGDIPNGTDEIDLIFINGDSNRIEMQFSFSAAAGAFESWRTANNSVTTGRHFIAVEYDGSNVSNPPVVYIDNVLQTITNVASTSGSYLLGTGKSFYIGEEYPASVSINGSLYSLAVYNRILTAAELTDAYNSRLLIPNYQGLVFAPILCGASGLQSFDGATVASGNKIIDVVGGVSGTPNGSPVGVAESYLRIR